ncbi:hypothetical protein [uncultured Polaribacter sp.]|uniref:hypothetical protein n=1 Tax=uncultured Polaribacter sp. TaxID=174711 RepID=UPI0030DA5CAD
MFSIIQCEKKNGFSKTVTSGEISFSEILYREVVLIRDFVPISDQFFLNQF